MDQQSLETRLNIIANDGLLKEIVRRWVCDRAI